MSSVGKRTRSHSEEDYPAKKFKIDAKGLKKERSMTSVLNLNDDCLEEVFFNLSQNDLISVWAANPRFKYAIERVFNLKYGKLQTVVSTIRDDQKNVINSSLELIHAFGHLITKLFVGFKLGLVAELLESIGNHCGKNIHELELCHFSSLYNNGLEKMNSFLCGLNEQFPNLHQLKLVCHNSTTSTRFPYFKSLAQPIPSLKSLAICGSFFSVENVQRFVDSNRQLECLSLSGDERLLELQQNVFNYLDAVLPQLSKLEIIHVFIPPDYGRPKLFQNLKLLSIGSHFLKFIRMSYSSQAVPQIAFSKLTEINLAPSD